MALLDLSLVTSALVKLLDENIKASPAWGAIPGLSVTGLPPDKLAGDATLGLYLYHVSENATYRNQTWPGRPDSPIRYLPMGIDLHYVVSAHSDLEGNLSPLREQLMMGLAIKTLHDFPMIDDGTLVSGVPVFPTMLQGGENRLRVTWRPVPPNEAVSYWTAGSQPLRLSAYYEVQVILLEPEEPPSGAGRVLTYNLFSFTSGLPRLDTSRSSVTFTIPTETTPRTVEVQPAQCVPGSELTLLGANLSGSSVALRVRTPTALDPVEADAGWGGVAGVDRFFASVRPTLNGATVLPGIHGAQVKVTRTFVGPDGIARDVSQVSNETPFMVVPDVISIGAVSATGVFTLTGNTFQDPGIPVGSVRTYIASSQLVAGTAGALHPGEFAILSATQIEMRVPSGLASGSFVPVRIVINGAESPPRWVTVP